MYLGSFFPGVSTFLVLIEHKVVPKASMIYSILSILEGSSSLDLRVSKVVFLFSVI